MTPQSTNICADEDMEEDGLHVIMIYVTRSDYNIYAQLPSGAEAKTS